MALTEPSLVVEITIDGITKRAEGSCFITLMQSIGEDPWDHDRLITGWKWIKSKDGWKPDQQPAEKPKTKKLGSKTVSKLEKRIAAWTKS